MIDHMDNKTRADVLRAEVALLMSQAHPAKPYLQKRIDELDPPRPVLPEKPTVGDVIDAEFHQRPHAGTFKIRLFYIGEQWVNRHGDSNLAFDHIVGYTLVTTGGPHV